MSHKLILICTHLRDDGLLPCEQIINDPLNPKDSGETYLCLECASIDPPWDIPSENLVTACKGCCKAFTITETYDARMGVAS